MQYLTVDQFNSIKKQISEIIYDQSDLNDAVYDFISGARSVNKAMPFEIVDNDSDLANYRFEKVGQIWKYIQPFGKVKFFFRNNNTRVSKRIIQYCLDENIDICNLQSKNCYILLDETSIHVAYFDYLTRFEESKEVRNTMGYAFKCLKRNQNAKKISDIIIGGDFIKIRPRNNIYCKNIQAYRNNWSYDQTYVEPIKLRYNQVFTKLNLNGSIEMRFKGEKDLLNLLATIYPDVLFQNHPDWLKPQSLDFFIPSLNTAIEFQGGEHYRPMNQTAKALTIFEHQVENDRRKELLCKQYGIRLIVWKYDLPITKNNLENLLK